MSIERINTSQASGGGAKKKRSPAKPKTKTTKAKSKAKTTAKPTESTQEPSNIGKVWKMAELMSMKRAELEKLAKEVGVAHPNVLPSKDDIIQLIGEAADVELPSGLTQKQELFCQLYASDKEFFGNGTQSYMEAYSVSKYDVAQANASRLLSNAMVLDRIDEILQEHQMNDQMVDKQIAFWVRQKASPQASIAAIKEYNLLKGRTGKGDRAAPTNLILIQNQNIHFQSPKARKVIEGFDQWLMENTKAEQPTEGVVDVSQSVPVVQ